MANNHRGPSELWDKYRHFLIETTDEHGKTRLVQNVSKIDRLSKQAAYFVLRSNCISDPFEALRIYRRRGVVEQDFNQLKNWVEGIVCTWAPTRCMARYSLIRWPPRCE